jgi:hypothetical protein
MDDLAIIPHNASAVPPLLQNLTQAGGATTFTWAAQVGRIYQVQYTADLSQTNWIKLGSPLMTGDYALTSFDPCTNQQGSTEFLRYLEKVRLDRVPTRVNQCENTVLSLSGHLPNAGSQSNGGW